MRSLDTAAVGEVGARAGKVGSLRVWMVVVVFVGVGTAAPVALSAVRNDGGDIGFLLLALFLWTNVFVTLWEMCLVLQAKRIQTQYADFQREYRGREVARLVDFFVAPIRWSDVFRPSRWAEVWSSYSLFDDSYVNEKSFGFWVDTGNGFFTLIPSLVLLYGMVYDFMPAQWLGIIGVALFWQKFYGTIIYFWAYFYNRHHVGLSKGAVAFVVFMNALWFLGPAWGMVVSVSMITSGDFDVIR